MIKNIVDHYFIFNGKSSLDFSAIIDGNQTFGSAERDVEEFQIPGRNGNLTIDNGRFKAKRLSYDGFIVQDFENNAEAFRNFLTKDSGYHRLEDTIHPDEYRLAMYSGPFDPKVIFLEAGSFTITFTARPERFLKSGEKEIQITTGTVRLYNPTYFTAKPLITVVSGTGAINVGETIITLTGNPGNTIIDCETEDAYNETTNMNQFIERTTGGFPTLPPGETAISCGEDMVVLIQPRWWII